MSHEAGHTDLEVFGGFEKGVWIVVRAPMSVNGYDDMDPESYHQLVHEVGGSDHNPVRGLAFLLGHSTDWRDSIRWDPDQNGEDWQRLQWMLEDEGDDPADPNGGNGRNDLQHAAEGIRVAAFFECGRGGYKHPVRDSLGISAVRGGLGRIISVSSPTSPIMTPTVPLPEDVPEPSEAGLIWPCCGVLTSAFGLYDPWGTGPVMHYGIDLDCGDEGAPIVAAHDGTVVFAGGNPAVSFGLYVDIIDLSTGLGTRYAHLSALGVSVGEEVSQGQLIGLMGNTGASTAAHLHFQVHAPVTTHAQMNNSTALDPINYMPTTCEDVEVGDLPVGVQSSPATSYTSWTAEGLDGTIISFVGDEWKEGPDDPAHSAEGGTWARLTQLVAMIHRRASIIGLSPTLLVLDGENIGTQWQNGVSANDVPAWNAVNGNHYLSARAFWAPRISAASGEAGIRSAWHYATDAFIGLTYGRCELMLDVEGANATHIANMLSFAGAGVTMTGLRRGDSGYEDSVTSGIVFLDDAQKVLDQGLAVGVQTFDWDDLYFWNYGNRWDKVIMKWAITTPVADMDVFTAGGEVVTIDNDIWLMPVMIVGDFFGRLLFESVDWKTGDRLPNVMWFENLNWQIGQSAPAHFHEIERSVATSAKFGVFFFELVQKDTFALSRYQFAETSGSTIFFGGELLNAEWAFFGSAGAQGIHGWHMHLERGFLAEGFMDTEDFIWFPVDPRLVNKDNKTVLQSPSGTLGDLKIVTEPFTDDEGDQTRRSRNAQLASRIILPRRESGEAVGFASEYQSREFTFPFSGEPEVPALPAAPGVFIPAPVGPPPGGELPEGVDEVYLSGNTTCFGAQCVNNSILNVLYETLIVTSAGGRGTYELAAYIAVMLTESGGDPGAVGICLTGLGQAIGLFQLLTGAQPSCPGSGGMGHPYSRAELQNVSTNINIARNALLDSWQGAVAQSGDPPAATTLASAFCSNGWEVGCISAGQPMGTRWLAIRDGVVALDFPLPG